MESFQRRLDGNYQRSNEMLWSIPPKFFNVVDFNLDSFIYFEGIFALWNHFKKSCDAQTALHLALCLQHPTAKLPYINLLSNLYCCGSNTVAETVSILTQYNSSKVTFNLGVNQQNKTSESHQPITLKTFYLVFENRGKLLLLGSYWDFSKAPILPLFSDSV